jgi:hypothetical protein
VVAFIPRDLQTEHRQVSVEAGGLMDRFKPNAAHVYRVED